VTRYTLELKKSEIIDLDYLKKTNLTLIRQLYISSRARLAFAPRHPLSLLFEKQIIRDRVCGGDHFWLLLSFVLSMRFFICRAFCARKEIRDLAPPIHVCLKLTIVHFWRIWFRARCHARRVWSHIVFRPTQNIFDNVVHMEIRRPYHS